MKYPHFVGGTTKSKSTRAAQERLVNLYVEPHGTPTATNAASLFPTEGVAIYSPSTGSSPGRASEEHDGRHFVVIGAEFIEVLPGGGRVVHGVVAFDTEPAGIAYQGDVSRLLLIQSAGLAYSFHLDTSAFGPVLVPSPEETPPGSGIFVGGGSAYVSMIDMLDSYFLVLDARTSTLYQSALASIEFPALNFAQRSIASDPWRAMVVHNREIWLLGDQTSEVWYNSQSFPFSFTPHPSSLIQFGVAAPRTAISLGQQMVWLARTKQGQGMVVAATGFQPRVVSRYEEQTTFEGYAKTGRIDDAFAFGYEKEGHLFYVLTFPSADATHVLDLSTGEWHERGTWIAEANTFQAWRPAYHAFAYGQHLCVNHVGGDIFKLTDDVLVDVDGRPLVRMRRCPALSHERRLMVYSRFELVLDAGEGVPLTGDGSDPRVELRLSDDGGKTFRVHGTRQAGKSGEYDHTCVFTRLGSAEDRVFEVRMSDPVPWRLTDAYLEMRPGTR